LGFGVLKKNQNAWHLLEIILWLYPVYTYYFCSVVLKDTGTIWLGHKKIVFVILSSIVSIGVYIGCRPVFKNLHITRPQNISELQKESHEK
jgi:hypothetical protein